MSNSSCNTCGDFLSGNRRRKGIQQCAVCESYHEYKEALDKAVQRRISEVTDDPVAKRIFNAPEGHRRLTINLPDELHTKLKIYAIHHDTTVTDIIVRFIKDELKLDQEAA